MEEEPARGLRRRARRVGLFGVAARRWREARRHAWRKDTARRAQQAHGRRGLARRGHRRRAVVAVRRRARGLRVGGHRPGGRRPAVRDVPRQGSRGRGRQHGRAAVARRPDGAREPGQHPDAGGRQRHRLPRHQRRRRRRRAADGEAGQGQHAAALCREAASRRDRRQRAGGRHDVRHQQRVADGGGLRDRRAEVATARHRHGVDRDGRWAAVPARRERRRGAGRGVAHGVSREGAVHAAESAAAPRRRPAHGTVEGLGPSRRRQRAAVHSRPGHHVGVRRPRGGRLDERSQAPGFRLPASRLSAAALALGCLRGSTAVGRARAARRGAGAPPYVPVTDEMLWKPNPGRLADVAPHARQPRLQPAQSDRPPQRRRS